MTRFFKSKLIAIQGAKTYNQVIKIVYKENVSNEQKKNHKQIIFNNL